MRVIIFLAFGVDLAGLVKMIQRQGKMPVRLVVAANRLSGEKANSVHQGNEQF